MSNFKPLEISNFGKYVTKPSSDSLYWKKYGFPIAFKEYGAIDYIDISLQEPYNIAVTCSSKLQIYNSAENSLLATISRFKETAYGGVFRKDGKLLIAGSEDGFVRLFEVQTNKLLRIFKGHKAAIHRCDFAKNGTSIATFSDDKTVVLWDIPTETKITTFSEHKDYIRAGVVNKTSQDIIISGSYDHTVKVYDIRSCSPILSVDHGYPVESVLAFPFGGAFISAGGTSIKVWDLIAGRMLVEISPHHKTITSLSFAKDYHYLMSASLDRHVKICNTLTYDVVHTLDYPSPILCVSSAPEDKIIAVGMSDGIFSLRHQVDLQKKEKKQKKNIFHHYSWYGADFKSIENDIVILAKEKTNLKKYDKYLRKFESSKALDAALKNNVQKRTPEVTVSVMMELIRRNNLRSAVGGRDAQSLKPLIKFVTKYIGDHRFMRILYDIANLLLEIYGPKLNQPDINELFNKLLKSLEDWTLCLKARMEIHPILKTILLTHSLNVNE